MAPPRFIGVDFNGNVITLHFFSLVLEVVMCRANLIVLCSPPPRVAHGCTVTMVPHTMLLLLITSCDDGKGSKT